MIYRPINGNGIGRMNYNNALQTLRSDLDIVNVIKKKTIVVDGTTLLNA